MQELLAERVLTHGFVHGHIHKHKDHTHIHGHIHNHDHDHHQPDLPNQIEQCPESDELALCDEIFCNDLDDCLFTNCQDTREQCQEHECYEEPLSAFDCTVCCDDPACERNLSGTEHSQAAARHKSETILGGNSLSGSSRGFGSRDSSASSGPSVALEAVCPSLVCKDSHCIGQHENNLCDLQLSKRPIFEKLINNVHSGVFAEPAAKRRHTDGLESNLQLHFPHECHPAPELGLALAEHGSDKESKPCAVSHHHIHQSCFHTTVPNSNADDTMSNFDFYVQFNNFADSLKPVDVACQDYLCQWENCQRTVNDQTLLQHVMESHINQEYSGSAVKSEAPYNCEWNSCNYLDSDLNSLINHVSMHKRGSNMESALTPGASDISASPEKPVFGDYEKLVQITPDTSMGHNQSQSQSPFGKKQTQVDPKRTLLYDSSCMNNANYKITAMEIRPSAAHLRCSHIDPTFTCHWQTHSENGQPVSCGKSHASAADLHEHVLNDHIESGQRLYDCCWIGCDRHNGKNFRQRQKLVRHLFIHTKHRPCVCHVCGASFAVDTMLTQHMRTHSGEKPYTCNVCGKRFSTSSSLSIHNRVHTGEKPLVCKWPGCGKRFRESSNLTKHMKVHLKSNVPEEAGLAPFETIKAG